MREVSDVVVVGTGALGLGVAWALLGRGLTVTVIGPRDGPHPGQASRAAGAMLSTFSEVEPGHDPARTLRPMPRSEATAVLADAAGDLMHHLLRDGGRLAPEVAAELAAFFPAALRALLDAPDNHTADASPLRLWQAAPVPEAIPNLLSLVARIEGRQSVSTAR
ncbi:MAG: FAD-binding oxidoreductase [Mycobacterium sp.]|nr:FAD-binding oxidoreductase [Mycobacterium sp.]